MPEVSLAVVSSVGFTTSVCVGSTLRQQCFLYGGCWSTSPVWTLGAATPWILKVGKWLWPASFLYCSSGEGRRAPRGQKVCDTSLSYWTWESDKWCGKCMLCMSRLAASMWVILLLCCGEGGWLCGMPGSPVGTPVPALCAPALLAGRNSGLGI